MSKPLKEEILVSPLPTELLATPQPPVALVGLDASGDHNPIWKAMGEGGGVTRQLKWILVIEIVTKSILFLEMTQILQNRSRIPQQIFQHLRRPDERVTNGSFPKAS